MDNNIIAKPRPQPQPSVPTCEQDAKEVEQSIVESGNTTEALAAALAYSAAGFDVYPVWQDAAFGRKPKAPATEHAFYDASGDSSQLERWWYVGSNLGMAMRTGLVERGPKQGLHLVVIDIDHPKHEGDADGLEMVRRWCDGEIDGECHVLPETLEQRSWSDGTHLFYLSKHERKCTQNGHLRIDVRGTGGGIVVAPTSITMADGSTGSYAWVGGFDPSRIAEADDEVEALLDFIFSYKGPDGPKPQKDGKARYVRPDHVPCGGRHDALVSYAAHLWGKGYSKTKVFSMVMEFAQSTCDQPDGDEIDDDEVLDILKWVFSKPQGAEAADGDDGQETEPDYDEAYPDDPGDDGAYPPYPDMDPVDDAEDSTSEEEKAIAKYVNGLVEKYKVYIVEGEGKKAKTVFHVENLVKMLLYGAHACTIGGAPAVWDGKRYLFGPAALGYMIELACPTATATSNKSSLKKVLARLEVERRFDLPSPCLIRFENGVLDIVGGEFRPIGKHSWQERIPNEIPHPLVLSAPPVPDVDRWLDTLADGHEDVRRNLLQVIFLCITRFTHHEQMVVLIGTGANGKSKFVDVLVRIVGERNVSSLSLDRMANRFEVGDLAGKLVNISSDISSTYLAGDGAAIWKQVTGGDLLKADVKGLEGYVFRAYCFLLVTANRLPKIEGGIDKAVSRRLHVIPFTHSFRDASGRYSADADPGIVDRICQPDAIAYLINLAIAEGMRMLEEAEFRFTPNYASEDEVHKLAIDNSSVLAWAEAIGLETDDLHMQRRPLMHERYTDWCKRSSMKPVAYQRFCDEVTTHFDVEHGKVRAAPARMNEYGQVHMADKLVQYNAFVIPDLYKDEVKNHVRYAEVVGVRDTLTSYSQERGTGNTRENHRIEEVNLGVWKADLMAHTDIDSNALRLRSKLWDEYNRFEG